MSRSLAVLGVVSTLCFATLAHADPTRVVPAALVAADRRLASIDSAPRILRFELRRARATSDPAAAALSDRLTQADVASRRAHAIRPELVHAIASGDAIAIRRMTSELDALAARAARLVHGDAKATTTEADETTVVVVVDPTLPRDR